MHDSEWCDHLPDVSPVLCMANVILSSLEDFTADPTNPNVYGLIENVKQSYKAVVDQYGKYSSFIIVIVGVLTCCNRMRRAC